MSMALYSLSPFGILLTIFLVFSLSTQYATAIDQPVMAPSPAAAPSPVATADNRFLWTCCEACANASVCYRSLLPSAGSFHGNPVKVARAATVIAFARLRDLYHELQRIPLPGGTGPGKLTNMALEYCTTTASISLAAEGDSLAALQRLETAAGRRRGAQAESDLYEASRLVSSVESFATVCTDDLISIRNRTAPSPVANKVMAWAADVHVYGMIALELVASIKL